MKILQTICNNMAEVPASELYDLDWPMTCDEVPSIKSLTCCTFPLTDGVLNTPLKMTSTFVRGTLASEYLVPNSKRALDTDKPKTPARNRSKHYCAQCPRQMLMRRDPATDRAQKHQGSWMNGSDLAPEGQAFNNQDLKRERQKAHKHACTGFCQQEQKTKFLLPQARVAVHSVD